MLALVRLCFEVALLSMLGYAVVAAGWRWAHRRSRVPEPRAWLRAGYAVLASSVALPIVAVCLPVRLPFESPVQVEATAVRVGRGLAIDATFGPLALGDGRGGAVQLVFALAGACLVALGMLGCVRLARDLRHLHRALARATPVKRVGRVVVAISDADVVPYSCVLGRSAFVVVPYSTVLDPSRLRLVVAHELAHVRARDTLAAHALAALRALLPWNVAFTAWERLLAELQELACDRAVLARRLIHRARYAECLLWAASLPSPKRSAPLVAMAAPASRPLERRLAMILTVTSESKRGSAMWMAAAIAVLAVVGGVAHATVADRRVTRGEAQVIADRLAREHGVVLPVTDDVLDELNRIVGTTRGRTELRARLARCQEGQPIVAGALARHAVPAVFAAIPLVESGCRPVEARKTPSKTAGWWQLVPGTARRFGLRVDSSVDDRLDLARESEAAAALLAAAHAELEDWRLAVAAYNQGTKHVLEGIAAKRTRDVTRLAEAGAINDYLGAVTAAALAMNAPELLE